MTQTPPRSRGVKTPELCQQLPSKIEGAGNAGCALHPQSRVQKVKSTRGGHHRFTGATRHSPRNGFNGFLRDLPGDRAFLSPSSCEYGWSAPGRADFASAKLDAGVEASGPHDFAVRNSIARLRACNRSRVGPRPATTIARRRCRVHRIPCPTFVTIAKRPSVWDGMAGVLKMLLPLREAEYFSQQGWTACPLICPSGAKSGAVPALFPASLHHQFVIPGRIEDANPESMWTSYSVSNAAKNSSAFLRVGKANW